MHSNTRMVATRESLRALACYVLGPARHARDGHIGLRSTGDGFATPVFDDGTRVLVRGDRLVVEPGRSTPITTVRAAAAFVGVELSAHPPVGQDLPPFEPDRHLEIDHEASAALAEWWALGDDVLATLGEPQLWPEHFDIAITVELPPGIGVNVGFSPGDAGHATPYVYVGPHDAASVDRDDPYWNAPFGALLPRHEVARRIRRAGVHPQRPRTSRLTYSHIGI